MKRQLLSLSLVVLAFAASAQLSNKGLKQENVLKTMNRVDVGTPELPNAFTAPRKTAAIKLGTSANTYSILRDAQTQVDYNADINSLIFVHRQNNGMPGGSGRISFDVSTDGGATWDSTTKVMTPSVGNGLLTGNRYPNGVIYNPAGNTNPANAYAVLSGAALTSVTGSWGMVFLSSSKLDGTGINESYWATPDTGSLIPGAMTTLPNGDIFILDTWDAADQVVVAKYAYNNGAFTPSFKYLPMDTAGAPDPYYNSQANLAFGPDGLTGYILLSAADTLYGQLSMKNHVWKTTDGGATWNKQPVLNWNTMQGVLDYTLPSSDTTIFLPWMRDYDMIVDANNKLHVIANMGSGSNPADPGYIWVAAPGSGNFSTNSVWHFTTDGMTWEADLIDPWDNSWGDIGGDATRWFGPRPQASRTEDGSKIFLTYTKTDTLLWQVYGNIAPDVWGYALDVTNGEDTLRVLTAGTENEAVCKWATNAQIVIENGSDYDFEIPVVYGEDQGDDLLPIQYYYAKGIGFNLSEFIPVNTEKLETALNVNVFPNPTTGVINVDLRALSNDVNIEVTNMVGQVVRRQNNQRNVATINLQGEASGVYFVRVIDGANTTTKKVVLTR